MKKSFRNRVRDYRLKREKDQPLDQAIYMTIATGRLEPLLRALAIYPVYSSGELRWQGESQFLLAYATRLRSPASAEVNAALLTEHLDAISEGAEDSQPIGALLNPGGFFSTQPGGTNRTNAAGFDRQFSGLQTWQVARSFSGRQGGSSPSDTSAPERPTHPRASPSHPDRSSRS